MEPWGTSMTVQFSPSPRTRHPKDSRSVTSWYTVQKRRTELESHSRWILGRSETGPWNSVWWCSSPRLSGGVQRNKSAPVRFHVGTPESIHLTVSL